ncbi:MAG: twin-arginine translocase TatA/TatE family subunit [Pseudomonadota bacterium]
MKQQARLLFVLAATTLTACTLGPLELGIILAIIVLLFGASRLPQLGKAMGETMKNFRKGASGEDPPETEDKPDEKK